MMQKIRQSLNLLIYKKAIHPLNRWLLKKSWNAAVKKALLLQESTGQTVWVYLKNRDFEAVPKQEFKNRWKRKNSKLKQRTLQQWKKYVYEFNGQSEPAYPGSD